MIAHRSASVCVCVKSWPALLLAGAGVPADGIAGELSLSRLRWDEMR
jgi:hypothetical protein